MVSLGPIFSWTRWASSTPNPFDLRIAAMGFHERAGPASA